MSEQARWVRIDLHVHAHPAAGAGCGDPVLGTLRSAAEKGLEILGLVDHSSVRSYEQLRLEMGRLAALREAGRLTPEEERTLAEYESLLARLLLLPGFEVKTPAGVSLLALFPPETPAERLYAILLNLGIPMERLREGTPGITAQADLPTAAALVSRAGGIAVISGGGAGHRLAVGEGALPEGIVALEIESLSDTLPPTALPTLWSATAGCRRARTGEGRTWSIGERYTEALLPERSFAALQSLLLAGQRERLRFPEHERLRSYIEQLGEGGSKQVVLCAAQTDPHCVYRAIAALANCGGGIVVIGMTEEEVTGVDSPDVWSSALTRSVREQIDPAPRLNLELLRYGEKEVIKVEVQAEAAPPYLTREGIVYLRRDGEVRPATRQELLELAAAAAPPAGAAPSGGFDLPQAGVEVVGAYAREGVWYYDVRDLRVTLGVTRQRAKGLWAYAIEQQEALRHGQADLSRARWKGDRGIWRAYRSGERRVYDLLHRDAGGHIDHVFFGVSEWGLTPRWREVVEELRPVLEEGGPLLEAEGEARPPEPRRGFYRPAPPPAVHGPAESEAAPGSANRTASPKPDAAAEAAASADAKEPPPERLVRPTADSWGGRMARWRDQAAVERVYWEGGNLYFDLAMRQGEEPVRYFRHVTRNKLAGAEGWADLVRVPLPATGVEVVRSTASGDEILYQFRDMQNGRVDPRVRRKAEFPPDSPWAYAIEMYHRDNPLQEDQVRWWGNIGYLRGDAQRVDLVYRDEEGRDHIYYAAERALLDGEWRKMLQVWQEAPSADKEGADTEQ